MSRKKRLETFVESRILNDLHSGSYEELLTMIDQAMAESDLFGDGERTLFATYPDRVVVVSEGGEFFGAKYAVNDGVVSFSSVALMEIDTISEEDVASSGVDRFYGGDSLAEVMRHLMEVQNGKKKSPLVLVKERLHRLFSGGKIWKKQIAEHRKSIGAYAWDVEYGKFDDTAHPAFDDLLNGDDEMTEEAVEGVISAVLTLENKLAVMLAGVREAYTVQQGKTSGLRDADSDQVVARYESFAADYIQYLNDVLDFVSGAIQEANEGGCILCTAKVHDEVVARLKDLDLAGRFVRKVASGFTE